MKEKINDLSVPKNKYIGVLCKRGHDWGNTGGSLRLKSDGHCVFCVKIRQQSTKHKEQQRKYGKIYYQNPEHKKQQKQYQKQYQKSEKGKAAIKRYQNSPKGETTRERYLQTEKHKADRKLQRQTEEYKTHKRICRRKRYQADLKFRLNCIISSSIKRSLKKGAKGGRHWETFIEFTQQGLRKSIEKQWVVGMTWENYGREWEIDHRIPVSAFNFDKPEHIDFKRCWALSNLQPMWKHENRKKSNKLIQDFQPSLKL